MDTLARSPIHQSILWPATIFGLPRQLAVLIGVVSLAAVVSLGQVWFLGVTVLALFLSRQVAKQDRYIFDISMAIIRTPPVLD